MLILYELRQALASHLSTRALMAQHLFVVPMKTNVLYNYSLNITVDLLMIMVYNIDCWIDINQIIDSLFFNRIQR